MVLCCVCVGGALASLYEGGASTSPISQYSGGPSIVTLGPSIVTLGFLLYIRVWYGAVGTDAPGGPGAGDTGCCIVSKGTFFSETLTKREMRYVN